jgi:predicted nuclease of restriction endonuclease-like (RecB) superfamily
MSMKEMSPQPDFSALLRLIHERRSRVARLVNRELIDLYWEIGHYLDDRINQDGWGKGTVRYLSDFLLSHEPGLRGFSSSNLWRMRQFYQTWRGASEASRQHFKDRYVTEFLDLPVTHSETDLRRALVQRLGCFLRELGRDFSFIGEEYPIQVGTRDGLIDLLFFHRGLNCLVAIELKITAFEPEHIGQLNFYLEALDRDVRKPHENPSIGILLCKTKDDEVVEYALSHITSPALVAEYQLQLPDKKLLQAKLHEFFELEAHQD